MIRTNLLQAELRKLGLEEKASTAQALEILRTLPTPIRHAVPEGGDDSRDYGTELLLMNIREAHLKSVQHDNRAQRAAPLVLPRRSALRPIVVNHSVADALRHMPAASHLRTVFSNLLTADDRVVIADMIAPTNTPVLRIRVQAIMCRNGGGVLSDGTPEQPQEQAAQYIDRMLDFVNVIYKDAGIEFVFYPSADITTIYDDSINQDFILPAQEASKLYNGTLSADDAEALTKKYSTEEVRTKVCNQYPQKMVLLFAEGTEITPAPVEKGWRRCNKCQTLFFGDDEAVSHCSAGGQHTADLTTGYHVYKFAPAAYSFDPSNADLQRNWKKCSKCKSLFQQTNLSTSCAAGGQHAAEPDQYVMDSLSSFFESMSLVADTKRQLDWRWCNKCGGLYLSDQNATATGKCNAGGNHTTFNNKNASLSADNYVLLMDGSTPRQIVSSPSGGGFSWGDKAFAKLSSIVPADEAGQEFYARFAAHEMGHYLGLWHPFVQFNSPPSLQDKPVADIISNLRTQILNYINQKISEGKITAVNMTDALDGDRGSDVFDTPADDGGELLGRLNEAGGFAGEACGPVNTCSIPLPNGNWLTYTPDRTIVMSYFKHCGNFTQRFSADQIKRMRDFLMNRNRRNLIAVQLGDTATPTELMCAVWSPGTAGQGYVAGYNLADFKKKCGEMNKANFRLVQQQAYWRNGVLLYDGIFNPGTVPEMHYRGWKPESFQNSFSEIAKSGWRVIHIETSASGSTINAIVNQNYEGAAFATGKTFTQLQDLLATWEKQGLQPTFLNSWRKSNGEICFDVVARASNIKHPHFLNVPEANFRKEYDDMWNKNHKLLSLDYVQMQNGTLLFSGIYAPDNRSQFVTWHVTREQILQNYDEMWAQDMKLVCMNMTHS